MTLQQYINNSADPDARDEVWNWTIETLTDLGLDHVHEAIEDECRFPESAWDDLFTALNNATAGNVREKMTEVFQDWIRHGPEIPDTPVPKGRAVDANRFLNWLDDQDVFASPSGKRRFLDDVRGDYPPTPPPHRQLQSLRLGHHLIWATFCEDVFDPFAEWDTAQEVRTGLGLMVPAQPEDQKLFLLVYRVPADVAVRFPTIADAYAGEGDWNPNFQCASPNASWGYTSGDAPEVVHEVIRGVHLIAPDPEGPDSVSAIRIVD
jgi:hypothetical protein